MKMFKIFLLFGNNLIINDYFIFNIDIIVKSYFNFNDII